VACRYEGEAVLRAGRRATRPRPNESRYSPTPKATAALDAELDRLQRIPLLIVDDLRYRAPGDSDFVEALWLRRL
jgi:hypothetical protein